jgi:hypothetical protein
MKRMTEMHLRKAIIIFTVSILLFGSLTSCQTQWVILIETNGQHAGQISSENFGFYQSFHENETDTLPLEQFLYINGFSLVEAISLKIKDGDEIRFPWDEIATHALVTQDGKLSIENNSYTVESISVDVSQDIAAIEHTILDIAPTMASALGLPPLPDAVGEVKREATAQHGVLIFLDGLQYAKLMDLVSTGLYPFFESLKEIHKGLTVYPPITTSATAALLTGAKPEENGVYGYGFRATDLTTLFDLAAENRKTVIAVEGTSLSFNLRNAETILSGDRDGDGISDDDVFTNSMEIIQSDMPDLLFVHFHDIDDFGHDFGPDSAEYAEAIQRVDGYLTDILQALPPQTFIILFADHGMHTEGEGGNHGHLLASDLIIPISYLETK